MQEITIIYTYYGQKNRIQGILDEKHPKTRIIIVDDCSPEPLQALQGVDIYRIDTDIHWNAGGAINLGFQEAEGWVICADIDHLITKENIEEILKIKKEKGTVYLLGRKFERESVSLFMIHKDDFEKIGGQDEDFSGNYGYMDIEFIVRCKRNFDIIERRDIKAEYFDDGANLDRDSEKNRILMESKDNLVNTGKRIRFQWHKI